LEALSLEMTEKKKKDSFSFDVPLEYWNLFSEFYNDLGFKKGK
jgi:hypothetical protein